MYIYSCIDPLASPSCPTASSWLSFASSWSEHAPVSLILPPKTELFFLHTQNTRETIESENDTTENRTWNPEKKAN